MTMQKPLSAKMNATILGQRLGAPVALHDPAAGPKCRKPQLRVAKDRHPINDLTALEAWSPWFSSAPATRRLKCLEGPLPSLPAMQA
jgi:hypothetical protein